MIRPRIQTRKGVSAVYLDKMELSIARVCHPSFLVSRISVGTWKDSDVLSGPVWILSAGSRISILRLIRDKQTVKLKLRFICTRIYCLSPHGWERALRFALMRTSGKVRRKNKEKKILKCFRNRALNKSIKLIYKPIKMLND